MCWLFPQIAVFSHIRCGFTSFCTSTTVLFPWFTVDPPYESIWDNHVHSSSWRLHALHTAVFVQIGVSINGGTQNGWFIVENPIKMDDLGVPHFRKAPNLCDLPLFWSPKSFLLHHFLAYLILPYTPVISWVFRPDKSESILDHGEDPPDVLHSIEHQLYPQLRIEKMDIMWWFCINFALGPMYLQCIYIYMYMYICILVGG